MIAWNEQPPDIHYHHLSDLLVGLPFMTALRLATGSSGPWVIFPDAVREGIFDHLRQRRIEMGGLLLGRIFRDTNGKIVVVVDRQIPSLQFNGTSVSLQMGTSVWDDARSARSAEQALIGWYHSHPDLGVFFSGTDRATQRAFFTQRHSLGLVVDPVRTEEAWFVGPGSEQLSSERIIRLETTP